jgi:hypothetical protein
VAEEETFRLYRLTYPSPMETPWPVNNVVPAEFYVPRDASAAKKVPRPSCSTSWTAARSCRA